MPSVDLALVICNPDAELEMVVAALLRCGLHSICCSKFSEAWTLFPQAQFRVVVCSDRVPNGGVPMVLDGLERSGIAAPLIVMSHTHNWDFNLALLVSGAYSIIECPFKHDDTEKVLRGALAMKVPEGELASAAA